MYPSAPTEGDKLDDDDDDEGWVVAVEEEEEDEEGGEIALLLSTLVDVAIVANEVGVVVADEADDGDGDTDDDAKDEDDNATEEDIDVTDEVVDVEAMPMYLAPRMPPFLTAAPRVFFR